MLFRSGQPRGARGGRVELRVALGTGGGGVELGRRSGPRAGRLGRPWPEGTVAGERVVGCGGEWSGAGESGGGVDRRGRRPARVAAGSGAGEMVRWGGMGLVGSGRARPAL